MKKLSIFILILIIFNITLSANKDYLGIEYVYNCYSCDKILKEKCELHKENYQKYYLLENSSILLNEFKRNEPRALHNYNKNNFASILNGKIEALDSGVFDNEYIIRLEDGTTVNIFKEKEAIDEYFKLNTGDLVTLICYSPYMSFEKLHFKNGGILNTSFENLKSLFNTL